MQEDLRFAASGIFRPSRATRGELMRLDDLIRYASGTMNNIVAERSLGRRRCRLEHCQLLTKSEILISKL